MFSMKRIKKVRIVNRLIVGMACLSLTFGACKFNPLPEGVNMGDERGVVPVKVIRGELNYGHVVRMLERAGYPISRDLLDSDSYSSLPGGANEYYREPLTKLFNAMKKAGANLNDPGTLLHIKLLIEDPSSGYTIKLKPGVNPSVAQLRELQGVLQEVASLWHERQLYAGANVSSGRDEFTARVTGNPGSRTLTVDITFVESKTPESVRKTPKKLLR